MTFFPVACLHCAVSKLNFAAVAHAPASSTWALTRFEHGAIKSGLAQFVSRNQPGYAASKNHHPFARPKIRGQIGQRRGFRLDRKQAERLHGRTCSPVATGQSYSGDESTPCPSHSTDLQINNRCARGR